MKNLKNILLSILPIILFTACANEISNEPDVYLNEKTNKINKTIEITNTKELLYKLENSLKKLKEFKKESNNSYSYTSSFSSWVGFGNETKVFIKDKKAVKREYKAWNNKAKITKTFIEDSKTINTNKEGFKAKSLESIYNECKEIIESKNTSQNRFYLTFDNKGLLNSCIYVPKNCADDCSFGVKIANIKAN